MKYVVKLKTEEEKTSREYSVNDYELALLMYKQFILLGWEIVGELVIEFLFAETEFMHMKFTKKWK